MGRYAICLSVPLCPLDKLMHILRSVQDIRLGCKVILGNMHAKIPIPYREEMAAEVKGKKLKFGYYLSGRNLTRPSACVITRLNIGIVDRWCHQSFASLPARCY